MKIYFMKII